MAVSVVHSFVNQKPDGGDATVVRPTDWNAPHTISGLATVAETGVYADLTGKPTLGSAAATASTDYATAAQGTKADSALQPAGNGSQLTSMTKSQVGLANVDNTSDAGKPVSTAQQTALNLKANLTSAALVTPDIGAATGTSLSLSGKISLANTGGAATCGQLTLVAGTKTVNTTAAITGALIFVQRFTAGGTIGFATTITINDGVSFTLNSDSALDTSVYNWWIADVH